MGINPDKTVCLNFFIHSKNDNSPRLWLKGNLVKYEKQCKFLGITFDQKLSFKAHIENIVSRCHKRLNLLKAIRGKDWCAINAVCERKAIKTSHLILHFESCSPSMPSMWEKGYQVPSSHLTLWKLVTNKCNICERKAIKTSHLI